MATAIISYVTQNEICEVKTVTRSEIVALAYEVGYLEDLDKFVDYVMRCIDDSIGWTDDDINRITGGEFEFSEWLAEFVQELYEANNYMESDPDGLH